MVRGMSAGWDGSPLSCSLGPPGCEPGAAVECGKDPSVLQNLPYLPKGPWLMESIRGEDGESSGWLCDLGTSLPLSGLRPPRSPGAVYPNNPRFRGIRHLLAPTQTQALSAQGAGAPEKKGPSPGHRALSQEAGEGRHLQTLCSVPRRGAGRWGGRDF